MALKDKKDVTYYGEILASHLKKLQGKGFANFIAKQSDELIKALCTRVLDDIFADFNPDVDFIPFCVIATEKYADNLISTSSVLEVLLVFKENAGFNVKLILKKLVAALEGSNLKLNIKICELDEIYEAHKNDHKTKAAFSRIRYICGSRTLYKAARSQIYKTREFNAQENLKFYAKNLGAFNEIPNIRQEPDLKNDLGGTNDIYYLNCALNGFENEISMRSQALKFIDEKELSALNLAADFILCVKSAQNLSSDSDVFDPAKLNEITALMQTKSKKTQENSSVISQKLFSCMHSVAVFSRYLVASFYRSKFKSGAKFNELRAGRLGNGFYRFESTIYVPLHARPKSLVSVLKQLLTLGDTAYKFDVSAIFYIKRARINKNDFEESAELFKQILRRNHAHCIIKALLDAEALLGIVKPLEHASHLAEFDGYHKFTVGEHCVLSVKFTENIKDKFVKSLYDELCLEGRTLLKLALLLHDAGKGLGGDHEVVGSNIFRAYAAKLNLSQKAVNIGVTLVRYHTLMNDVANREDIYDQRTIFSFISKLGDPQTLRLAYIITYCVINATDEKLYTPYLARLLRELYGICLQSFEDENLLDEATRRVKKELSIRRNAKFAALSENLKEKIFDIRSNLLFAKYQPADIIVIAQTAQSADKLSVRIQNHQSLSIEIYAQSYPNLAVLLSALAHLDLGFMEIFELFEGKFYIKLEFNKNVKSSELETLKNLIEISLKSDALAQINRPVILKGELSFDEGHSQEYAKLGINAKDQRGLMAYVLGVFKEFDVKIANARIQTIKNRTRNLLLIQKQAGVKFSEILKLLESE